MSLTAALFLLLAPLPAHANPKKDLQGIKKGPSANVGEIPALAELLRRSGWEPTPELSGAFKAGYVFQETAMGHRLQLEDCFQVEPSVSTYTSAEVVTQLQAGVSVRAGVAKVSLAGSLVKKVKFSTPEHIALPALKMIPTESCQSTLRGAADAGVDLSKMYVVQEVLTAEIAEQTCGRIDAAGKFSMLGSAEVELAMACAQESLEPVAIAYRITAVGELAGLRDIVTSHPKPHPKPPKPPKPAPHKDEVAKPVKEKPPKADKSAVQAGGRKDVDADGIRNDEDACPEEPEDLDDFEDEDGCPDPDNDRDGVADAADECPDEGEDADGFADEDGCPDPDNDEDGVLDAEDACPMDPEDMDGFEDKDGCPDTDNDGDKVPDVADSCPNEVETYNGFEDTDGCPDEDPRSVMDEGLRRKWLFFDTNSATIKPATAAELAVVLKLLRQNPGLKLYVRGHDDNVSSSRGSADNSARRAKSVVDWLVEAGISPGRVEAKSYGPNKPIASNDTPEGQAQNRRVDFAVKSL